MWGTRTVRLHASEMTWLDITLTGISIDSVKVNKNPIIFRTNVLADLTP